MPVARECGRHWVRRVVRGLVSACRRRGSDAHDPKPRAVWPAVRQGDVMDRHDQARQEIERIMRRAAEIGYDPARVAPAMDHRPAVPIDDQAVMAVERQSWFGALVARRLARRSG